MARLDFSDRFRSLLLARRSRLTTSLSSELALQVHEPDEAYDAMAFAKVSMSESKELAEIRDALVRINEGTFGVCQECGENILNTRLEVLPYTTNCVKCQTATESGRN